MGEKRKTIHYVKYTIEHTSEFSEDVRYVDLSFGDYLEKAVAEMSERGPIEQRLDTEGRKVVLSLYEKRLLPIHSCLSGTLFITQAGKKVAAASELTEGTLIVPAQTVIEDDDADKASDITKMRIVDPAEQITCFACFQNHLAYISDSPNAAKRLYDFFYFLFKSLTHVLPATSIIHEERDIIVNPTLVLQHNGISAVRYKFSNCGEKDDLDAQIHGIIGTRFAQDSILQCRQKALLQECSINLRVSLGKKDRGMKAEVLKFLLTRMSDSELSKTTVYFKDGYKMQGTKFRPDSKVKVLYDNSVINQIDAQRASALWLNTQIREKKLS